MPEEEEKLQAKYHDDKFGGKSKKRKKSRPKEINWNFSARNQFFTKGKNLGSGSRDAWELHKRPEEYSSFRGALV